MKDEHAELIEWLRDYVPPEEAVSCRNVVEEGDSGDNHCNKPAEYIVWGGLAPPENLGPRCEDCLIAQHPTLRLYKLPQYAIYRLPAADQGVGETARLRKALRRLQMGPDTLTQYGLGIVLDALYPDYEEEP